MSAPDVNPGTQESAQRDALHALAQPLTSLSFILDIARRQSDPAVWHSALGEGLDEVRRAVTALQQLRSALDDTVRSTPSTPTPNAPGEK